MLRLRLLAAATAAPVVVAVALEVLLRSGRRAVLVACPLLEYRTHFTHAGVKFSPYAECWS